MNVQVWSWQGACLELRLKKTFFRLVLGSGRSGDCWLGREVRWVVCYIKVVQHRASDAMQLVPTDESDPGRSLYRSD
jgi:hypothetical protein